MSNDNLYGNRSVTAAENREHSNTLLAKRVTDVGSDQQIHLDESVSGTTYIGRGAKGLATSADGWLVKKMVETDTTLTIQSAIGAWDDRASLTYT